MQQLIWFACGVFVGAMGMFSVMLYLIMTKEWQRLLHDGTKDKP